MIQTANATVHLGNNLDILPTLPDNSVDSIVTDPPYELGFMGKKWDNSGIAYSKELWTECLRVLKPGGHLLAFGGTRTWHRIAVAIEDSGFEVRDSIAWMYGSGFPKSLDISKAIDKRGGQSIGWFGEWLRKWRVDNGITQKEVAALFPSKTGNLTGCVANWELGLNLPTAEQFTTICQHFNLPFDSLAEAEREVVGQSDNGIAGGTGRHAGAEKSYGFAAEFDITKAATEEAKTWEGWGTALKPAFEPIIVARKPLIGTVAENVLTHGTGGLNIDGSRIGTGTGEKRIASYPDIRGDNYQQGKESYAERGTVEREVTDKGRWPANVILDEYTAGLLDEQSDASRFFYVAKASKRDRNEGLEGLPDNLGGSLSGGNDTRKGNEPQLKPTKNFHPTVKPTDLMRYLVKLVTPPNGTVLDPFTGSGSTGKAAILEGFKFIGIELTEDYYPIIEGRLNHAEQVKQAAEKKKEEELF